MITTRPFGKTNKGNNVTLYTIDSGVARASVMDFGANLVKFEELNDDSKEKDKI